MLRFVLKQIEEPHFSFWELQRALLLPTHTHVGLRFDLNEADSSSRIPFYFCNTTITLQKLHLDLHLRLMPTTNPEHSLL